MNREEYISTMEKSLVGRIDPDALRETMAYYNDYFAMEQSKGLSEEQIISNLGDPRLLAKSIIAAESEKREDREHEVRSTGDGEYGSYVRRGHIPFGILMLIIVLVFFGIISLIFSIASALLPILLPALIVFGIITFFKNRS